MKQVVHVLDLNNHICSVEMKYIVTGL